MAKTNEDRAVRIGVAFARQAASAPAARLCSACVEVLDVTGAGVSIMSGVHSGPVCSSDKRMGRLENLQFSLGEGPCHDAFTFGEEVFEPDLRRRTSTRWPLYTPSAIELGARGVFAFPLTLGSSRIGVLTVYQDDPGSLTDAQSDDGRVIADVLAQTMVSIQARHKPGVLADELSDASAHRAEIHQASGMLSVQLEVPVEDALLRIRAYAYASEQTVADVAQQIVSDSLRLGDDTSSEPE